jgi:hypothetical protein
MSHNTMGSALALALALALSAAASAQERRQGGGNGSGLPPYNLSTEVTVSGKVASTETAPTMSGGEMATVTVTVDGGPIHVLLAPPDFIKKQAFAIAANAPIQITGMPGLRLNGEPAMIARTLKIGTRTMTLRDATGKPAWE